MIQEILASTVAASVVTSIVNYLIKRFDYKTEYNKKILEKRISALSEVEAFVQTLKVAVLDKDNNPYHFALTMDSSEIHRQSASASVMAMWISESILNQFRDYNQIIFGIPTDPEEKIKYAKINYVKIAELRHKIETSLMEEYLTLPDVRKFLKKKSLQKSEYREFHNTQLNS